MSSGLPVLGARAILSLTAAFAVCSVLAVDVRAAVEPTKVTARFDSTVTAGDPETWVVPETEPLYVRLRAAGEPFQGTRRLVDGSGLNVASVVAVEADACKDIPLRKLGLGLDEWCLEVTELNPGSEATGLISTEKSKIQLTASVRDSFFALPLITTLAGLAASVLLVWLSTNFIGAYVSRARVQALVARHGGEIGELDEWVRTNPAHKTDRELFKIVDDVTRYGPKRAEAARARLKAALTKTTLPGSYELIKKCQEESNKSSMNIGDFIDDSGTAKTHPADEKVATLKTAEEIALQLKAIGKTIEENRNIPEADRGELQAQLQLITDDFAAAATDKRLAAVGEEIEALKENILQKLKPPHKQAVIKGFGVDGEELPAFPTVPSPEDAAWELGKTGIEGFGRAVTKTGFWSSLAAAGAITLVVAMWVLIVTVTVGLATWGPNATFGVWNDYIALFSAAFASSAAATIVAVVLLWKAAGEK